MSRNATTTLAFADGIHTFRLGIAELEELQEKCNAGPRVILSRIDTGAWRLNDIRETLRLGLIGGGMKPLEALQLIDRYVEPGQLVDHERPALMVLSAALVGSPDNEGTDDEAGEMTGETQANVSPTES
ncbi:gene transfer agent family protein [Asticcacaulis sp.]|uniref:gene transfer agent family protein n=1 Tax=Asticcacaulis sp. TaxID=1872648 RepID=UPI003F7B4902